VEVKLHVLQISGQDRGEWLALSSAAFVPRTVSGVHGTNRKLGGPKGNLKVASKEGMSDLPSRLNINAHTLNPLWSLSFIIAMNSL
jgi:hypothetical protein